MFQFSVIKSANTHQRSNSWRSPQVSPQLQHINWIRILNTIPRQRINWPALEGRNWNCAPRCCRHALFATDEFSKSQQQSRNSDACETAQRTLLLDKTHTLCMHENPRFRLRWSNWLSQRSTSAKFETRKNIKYEPWRFQNISNYQKRFPEHDFRCIWTQ